MWASLDIVRNILWTWPVKQNFDALRNTAYHQQKWSLTFNLILFIPWKTVFFLPVYMCIYCTLSFATYNLPCNSKYLSYQSRAPPNHARFTIKTNPEKTTKKLSPVALLSMWASSNKYYNYIGRALLVNSGFA